MPILVALVLAIWLLMPVPTLAQPPLNGNVETDFTGPDVVIFSDGVGDVGLPAQAPLGTVSGWDMKDLRICYNATTDTMYIGINVGNNSSTILGDADGDGNPGGTSAWLGGLGGTDVPNLGLLEAATVYFDLNEDGTWDVIAGISATGNYSSFSVNSVTYPFQPAYSFGSPLTGHIGAISSNPDGAHPDLEFTITGWSTLPGQDRSAAFCGGVFLGSYADAGIGEDSLNYCYGVEPPVGGIAFPVDRFELLAPWAVLLGCAALVTLLVLRRRRQA